MPNGTNGCALPRWRAPATSPPTRLCRSTRRCTGNCSVRDLLRLVRAGNLLLAAAGVCAGGWIALGAPALPKLLAFAALSGIGLGAAGNADRKSTRLNSSHVEISYAVFCLKKKTKNKRDTLQI